MAAGRSAFLCAGATHAAARPHAPPCSLPSTYPSYPTDSRRPSSSAAPIASWALRTQQPYTAGFRTRSLITRPAVSRLPAAPQSALASIQIQIGFIRSGRYLLLLLNAFDDAILYRSIAQTYALSAGGERLLKGMNKQVRSQKSGSLTHIEMNEVALLSLSDQLELRIARRGRLPEWTCQEHLRERGPRSSHSAAACCLLPTAHFLSRPSSTCDFLC